MWACAIALFFNRWGKIRMLLPYQPEYKRDQLKVPGTGATNTCHIHHSNQVTPNLFSSHSQKSFDCFTFNFITKSLSFFSIINCCLLQSINKLGKGYIIKERTHRKVKIMSCIIYYNNKKS